MTPQRGCQAPLSIGLSRQDYWSGLPLLPGDLPDPGIELRSLASPALAGRFFTAELPGKVSSAFSIDANLFSLLFTSYL